MTQTLNSFRVCGLHTLARVDDHNRGIRRHQGTVGILREILVSRRIQNVDAIAVIFKLQHRRGHGNTSLLFDLHPVGNCVSGCCLTFHGTRQVDRSAVQQEFLCQSSLSGIRVRDNCKCSSSVDFFFQIAQRISPRLSIRKHPDRLPDASCLHNPNQPPPFFHAGSRISAQLESVYHIFFCLARISFGDSKQP